MARARNFHTIITRPTSEDDVLGYITWHVNKAGVPNLSEARRVVEVHMRQMGYPPDSFEWV